MVTKATQLALAAFGGLNLLYKAVDAASNAEFLATNKSWQKVFLEPWLGVGALTVLFIWMALDSQWLTRRRPMLRSQQHLQEANQPQGTRYFLNGKEVSREEHDELESHADEWGRGGDGAGALGGRGGRSGYAFRPPFFTGESLAIGGEGGQGGSGQAGGQGGRGGDATIVQKGQYPPDRVNSLTRIRALLRQRRDEGHRILNLEADQFDAFYRLENWAMRTGDLLLDAFGVEIKFEFRSALGAGGIQGFHPLLVKLAGIIERADSLPLLTTFKFEDWEK